MDISYNGNVYNFAAVVELMDDDIRELIHSLGNAETEQEFFDIYADLHNAYYGAPFEIN